METSEGISFGGRDAHQGVMQQQASKKGSSHRRFSKLLSRRFQLLSQNSSGQGQILKRKFSSLNLVKEFLKIG